MAGCINLGAKDIFPWGWRLPLAIAGVLHACLLTLPLKHWLLAGYKCP